MKNRPVMDKLRTQERELNTHEIFFVGEKKKIVDVKTDKYKNDFRYSNTTANQFNSKPINTPTNR